MPTIFNRLFQPLVILLGNGKTLYIQSRKELDVSSADLEEPHLKSLLASEKLILTEPGARVSAPPRRQSPELAAPEPAAPESAPEPVPESAPEPAPVEVAEETKSRRHKGRRGSHGYRGEDESE